MSDVLSKLLVESWMDDHKAAAKSESKISVEDVSATRIIRLCASHEAFRLRAETAESAVAALRAEVARLTADLAWANERESRLRAERDGNVWLWQGDGDDHPESLTCQVLIRPDDLRALLAARDTATPENQ